MLSGLQHFSLALSARPGASKASRRLHDSAWNLGARLAVSLAVSAIFTTALVGAQAPGTQAPRAGNSARKPDQQQPVKAPIIKNDRTQNIRFSGGLFKPLPVGDPANVAARQFVLDRQRENVIARYKTMGRPFLRAELIFVRHVCGIGQEQFRQLSRDAELVLTNVVTKMVDDLLHPKTLGGNANLGNGKLLQDSLTALMKRSLSVDQWSRYQAELEKRLASRKPIAVRYLVNAIDRDLYLSDGQRARLTESLSTHWDDGWNIYLDYMLQGNSFYPSGIDSVVSPVLNDVQKTLWRGAQRVNVTPVFGAQVGRFAQDTDALEEERGEVKKVEPGKAEMDMRRAVEAQFQVVEMQAAAEAKARFENRKAEAKKSQIRKAEGKKTARP
jgi:hypothetical protein